MKTLKKLQLTHCCPSSKAVLFREPGISGILELFSFEMCVVAGSWKGYEDPRGGLVT
jgi:hypothetical protein